MQNNFEDSFTWKRCILSILFAMTHTFLFWPDEIGRKQTFTFQKWKNQIKAYVLFVSRLRMRVCVCVYVCLHASSFIKIQFTHTHHIKWKLAHIRSVRFDLTICVYVELRNMRCAQSISLRKAHTLTHKIYILMNTFSSTNQG